MAFDLSIAICSYNRAQYLPIALDSILNQNYDLGCIELLLIDNNSTDNTKEVFDVYSKRIPNFRYFFEIKQGLSHARNRAISECDSNYLGYLDDDAEAPKHWINHALRIIKDIGPDAFGGPFIPLHLETPPKWFKDSYESSWSTDDAGYIHENYLNGGNMFFRRQLLVDLNGFSSRYGMAGNSIAYAEEIELQNRIRQSDQNHKIYYDPDLFIRHLVRPIKYTLKWRYKSIYANARSRTLSRLTNIEYIPKKRRLIFEYLKNLLLYRYSISILSLLRDRNIYPYYQQFVYEVSIPKHVSEIGRISILLKSDSHGN